MPRASGACPICGASGAAIINLRFGFQALRCTGCTAVYADPMPSADDLAAYYSQWMFSKPAVDKFEVWERHSTAGTAAAMKEIGASRATPVRNALDFGGGLGFFANALSKQVADVTLFDMSGPSRDYARSAFPAITVCDEPEVALARGPFDLILLNQVIEHVPDPIEFIRPLIAALAPDGILIITTPNNRMADRFFRLDLVKQYASNARPGLISSAAKLLSDSWLCLDPPRHIYAFTGESLGLAVEKAGGRALRISTKSYRHDPFGYPTYAKEEPRGGRTLKRAYRLAGSSVAEALDWREQRGNTLVGYFERV